MEQILTWFEKHPLLVVACNAPGWFAPYGLNITAVYLPAALDFCMKLWYTEMLISVELS